MRRIALVVCAVALITATGAAGYELAPQSPAGCWLTVPANGIPHIVNRQRDGWQTEVCIFEKFRKGIPVEQTNLSQIGFLPAIMPISAARPHLIFHYREVR